MSASSFNCESRSYSDFGDNGCFAAQSTKNVTDLRLTFRFFVRQ